MRFRFCRIQTKEIPCFHGTVHFPPALSLGAELLLPTAALQHAPGRITEWLSVRRAFDPMVRFQAFVVSSRVPARAPKKPSVPDLVTVELHSALPVHVEASREVVDTSASCFCCCFCSS